MKHKAQNTKSIKLVRVLAPDTHTAQVRTASCGRSSPIMLPKRGGSEPIHLSEARHGKRQRRENVLPSTPLGSAGARRAVGRSLGDSEWSSTPQQVQPRGLAALATGSSPSTQHHLTTHGSGTSRKFAPAIANTG